MKRHHCYDVTSHRLQYSIIDYDVAAYGTMKRHHCYNTTTHRLRYSIIGHDLASCGTAHNCIAITKVVLTGDFLAITTFDQMELDEFWEQSNSTWSLWHTELVSRECWLFSNSKAGKSREALLDSHSATGWVGLSDVPQGTIVGPVLFSIMIDDIRSSRSRSVGACNSHTKPMSRHFYRLIDF